MYVCTYMHVCSMCIWYHVVLKMVQLDCTSLKACTSPHYEEHQRRRNKAVLPAVSKLTEQEEVNPPFQLPIERT